MPANTPRGYTFATSDDANDLALISQRLAEQLDADVQGLYDPVPAAMLSSGATQNIAAGNWTELNMGSPTSNDFTRGGVTKTSAGNRLIIPTTGVYTLSAQANWPSGSANRRGITFTVNGNPINGILADIGPASPSGATNQSVAGSWVLGAGAEVGVAVFQDTSGTITVNAARLQLCRAGA